LFEQPEEFRLQHNAQSPDFIKKPSPSISPFGVTRMLPIGAGERAALVSKKLALDERVRQRRTI
jgi:hypothetical protein